MPVHVDVPRETPDAEWEAWGKLDGEADNNEKYAERDEGAAHGFSLPCESVDNCVHIKDASAPGAAAGVLQCRPEAGVVG